MILNNLKNTSKMKKIFFSILFLSGFIKLSAQENVYPATKQLGTTVITNATVHVGNGQVLSNASIEIKDGKITQVGTNITPTAGATVVNAQGKHVYPGLILPMSTLGLVEISAVRATSDAQEIGDLNPNVRAIIAYNTDSRVINTLRSNGILLANVVPQGGTLSGTSSVVQLDAWNWEDAAYATDQGVHFRMPTLMARPRFGGFGGGGGGGPQQPQPDPVKEGLDRIDEIKSFFYEAKAYNAEATHAVTNLKLESVKGLFDKKQKLYIHANTVKQMLIALEFVKEFGFDVVIVGGMD